MKFKTHILISALFVANALFAAEPRFIRLTSKTTELILRVADDQRLKQCYFGKRLAGNIELNRLPIIGEAYPAAGSGDYFDPALFITHADGNPGTVLLYKSMEVKDIEGGTETIINLRDEQYPIHVALHYAVYPDQDVYKVWSEISHTEKRPVRLSRYASTLLRFNCESYYLTEFSSDWAREAQMKTQRLEAGKKILDSQLGSRAAMFMHPFFELGLNSPAEEHRGEVLVGIMGWTGNFSFTFEIDNNGVLRLIPAINPYASEYTLKADETFTTPEFVFTLSSEGASLASRNLHRWARNYQLRDGKGDRLTLLNNWENTYFNFDQAKLGKLMHEAKELGVDMFLLDDGWFGNKHPRSNDHAGLGDWEVTRSKLPGGVPALVDSAKSAGVKFGIWIEPEMVNPKSELFENHPDWAIHQPDRKPYYYRNQLVLDLCNPKVQDFVYSVVERIMKENPEVSFFKWDCNSPITNVYSAYLGKEQGNLYIDHVRGVYNVMKRVRDNYPNVPMMLCAGGGGRCDYEALKYFTEFWCSDNTDPVERLYIQWGFSQLFPAKAMCAHVTSWNSRTSIKFRVDVASMCKLGFDLGLSHLSTNERKFCREAVTNYKRMKPVILDGDLYRLVSPYKSNHMAVMYVDQNQDKAVLFGYDIHPRYGESIHRVCLQGLDANKRYRLRETNLMPGSKSNFGLNDQVLTGDYLMKIGVPLFSSGTMSSRVIELTTE